MNAVLLVDDDRALSKSLQLLMKRMGHEIDVADSGAAAVERLGQRRFGAIVSDMHMPEMDGLELLEAVRTKDLDVPVILMTGCPTFAAGRALERGVFHYLVKPFPPRELDEVLGRAIKLHELARLRRQALERPDAEGHPVSDAAALEARFEAALAGLSVATQPIVRWSRRGVAGYEAFVRTEESSLRHPLALLDAAERLGRTKDLGRAIRARIVAILQTAPPSADVFINVHMLDLLDDELYAPGQGLAPWAERIVLEITERARLEQVPEVPERVARLRKLGYRIALDDLGAGYAGLNSFVLLEPEIVKLDRSLIRAIDRRPAQQDIVGGVVRVCRALGIEVVAEGVETEGERDCAVALGCDLLQGYLFAAPDRPFATARLE